MKKNKRIGLISVDGGHFPNFALLKIAGYYSGNGCSVEWVNPLFGSYDAVFASKVFTFTPDYAYYGLRTREIFNLHNMKRILHIGPTECGFSSLVTLLIFHHARDLGAVLIYS